MRTVDKGLVYFPLDCSFFQNKKIKRLRREHGSVGVLTYINLLCRIYERGYYITFESIEDLSMDIAEDIACDQLRKTATQVTETISYLVVQGILDESLYRRGVISGAAIQKQYAEIVKGLKRKATIDIYSLLEEDEKKEKGDGAGGSTPKNEISSEFKGINSEEKAINSEEMQQRESEKEKENITHTLRAYGKHKNVMLTEAECAELKILIPDADSYIDRFSEKMASKGYVYNDHFETLKAWWTQDKDKYKDKYKAQRPKGVGGSESTYDLNEFFNAAARRSYNGKE